MSDAEPILLFDGVCNLCSATVALVLRAECPPPRIRFAAMQGDTGRRLLARAGEAPDNPDTFLFIEHGEVLKRSAAALALCRHLRWPWRAARALGWLPARWTDRLYDLLARNRYRWFGRRDHCLVPAPGTAERFLP